MAALHACGFNAHGQISPFRVGSSHMHSVTTDDRMDEEYAGDEAENENEIGNEIGNENSNGIGAARVQEVQDDFLALRRVVAGGGGGGGGSKDSVSVVYAGWSESAVILNSCTLYLQGNCTRGIVQVAIEDPEVSSEHGINVSALHSFFGDHNGLIGCLGGDGKVLLLEKGNRCSNQAVLRPLKSETGGDEFDNVNVNDAILLRLIALAGNGRVAAIPIDSCQAGNQLLGSSMERVYGRLTIYEFETLDIFRIWITARGMDKTIKGMRRLHINHGSPFREEEERIIAVQLIAIASSFAVLLSDGSVYTWGDARHCSTLGRNVLQRASNGNCENNRTETIPAHRPGQVTVLGGLRIHKIVGKGWYMAALTDDKEAYVWGGRPGNDQLIRDLVAMTWGTLYQDDGDQDNRSVENTEEKGDDVSSSEDVHLLHIPSVQDILDVGVGCNHLAVLARMENGYERVMAFGMGENGQLGLGKVVEWSSKFVELLGFGDRDDDDNAGKRVVVGVSCSDYCTFVVTA